MSTFIQQMPLRLQDDTIYVCERSIHSSFNVFTKLIEVSASEQFMLQEIYSGYAATDNVKGIIYIKSDPEDCMERASIEIIHLIEFCPFST